MPTFLKSRERLFLQKNPDTLKMVRKRSDGRLKSSNSAIDLRSWTNDRDRQREYFLEKMNSAQTGYGNYVPILELLDILGLKENSVLLDDTIEKLNVINDILKSKDSLMEELTKSEEELKARALSQKESNEDGIDNNTVRNLRNLVKDLIEQYKYFTGVKEENEDMRKCMSEQSELLGTQIGDLTYQRNVLRARVEALSGVEEKVEKLKKDLDNSRNIIKRLRKQLDEFPGKEDYRVMKEKAESYDKMKNECDMLRAKMLQHKKVIVERDDLIKENDFLQSVYEDQEDEIQNLIEKIEELTGGGTHERRVPEVERQMALSRRSRTPTSSAAGSFVRRQGTPRPGEEIRSPTPTLLQSTPEEASGSGQDAQGTGSPQPASRSLVTPEQANEVRTEGAEEAEPDIPVSAPTSTPDEHALETQETTEPVMEMPPMQKVTTLKEDEGDESAAESETEGSTRVMQEESTQDALDFQARCAYLEETLHRVTDKLTELVGVSESDKKRIEELELELAASQAKGGKQNDELDKALADLKTALEAQKHLETELEKASKENEKLLQDLADSRKEAVKTGDELKDLNEFAVERDACLKKLGELEKALLDKQKELDDIKLTVSQLENELNRCKAVDSKNAELQQQLELVKKQLAEAEGKINVPDEPENTRSLANADDLIAKLKEEINKKEMELTEAKNAAAKKQTELDKALEDSRKTNDEVQNLKKLLQDADLGKGKADNLAEELKQKQEALDEAKRALGNVEEKLNKSQLENTELKSEINGIKAQNKDLEGRIAQLLKTSANTENEMSALKKQLEERDKELNDAKQELSAAKLDADNLKKSLQKLQEELGANNITVGDAQKRIADLEKALNDAKLQCKTFSDDLEKCRQENENTRKQFELSENRHSQAMDDLLRQLKQKEDEATALRDKLKHAEAQIIEFKNQADDQKKINRDLQDDLNKQKTELSNEGDVKNKLENQLANALEKLKGLEAELEKANGKIKDLNNELVRTNGEKSSCQQSFDEAKKKIAELEQQLEGLKTIKDRLEGDLKDMTGNLMAEKDKGREVDNRLSDLQKKLKGLEDEKRELEKAREKLDAENTELKKNLKEVEALKEKSEGALYDAGRKLEDLNNKAAEDDLEKWKSNVFQLESALGEEKTAHDNTKNDLNKANKQIEDLQQQLNASQLDSNELKRQLKASEGFASENDKLKDSLQKCQDENERLHFDLKNLKSRFLESGKRIKELNGDIDKLKEQLKAETTKAAGLLKSLNDCEKNAEDVKKEKNQEIEKLKDALVASKKMQSDANKKLAALKKDLDGLLNENAKLTQEKTANQEKAQKETDNLEQRNKDLQRQLENAKEGAKQLQSDVDNLKEDNRKLAEEMDALKRERDDLRSVLNENKGLKTRLEDAIGKSASAKEDIAKLKRENKQKSQELDACNKLNKELQDELRQVQNDLNKLKDDFEQSQLENTLLKDEISKISDELKSWKDVAKTTEAKLAVANGKLEEAQNGFEKERNALHNELQGKERLLNEAHDKNKVLEGLLGKSQQEVDNLNDELDKTKAQVRNLLETTDALQSDLNNWKLNFEELQSQLKACEAMTKELVEDLKRSELLVYKLKNELSEVSKSYESKNRESERLEAELKESRKAEEKSKREIERLMKRLADVTNEKNEILSKSVVYEQQVQNLESELQSCLDANHDMKGDLHICSMEVTKLEKEQDDLKREIFEKNKQIDNLSAEKEQLQDTIDLLKKTTENLSDTILGLKAEMDAMKQSMHNMSEAINEMKNKKDFCETELKIASQKLHECQDANDNLHYQIAELERLVATLHNDILQKDATIAGNNLTINKLKQQINSLLDIKHDLENQWEQAVGKCEKTKNEKDRLEEQLQNARDAVNDLQGKLRAESDVVWQKMSEIHELKKMLAQMKEKCDLLEEEKEELLIVKEDLLGDIADLKLEIIELKARSPKETPFMKIIQKILKSGNLNELTMEELAALHNATSRATARLVELEKAQLTARAPVVRIGPSLTEISDQKKAILKKTAILQNEVTKRQLEARKRTCALTQAIQQYQRELASLRIWDENLQMAMSERTPEEQARQAILKAQAQTKASQINHCLCMTENEKQRALDLEAQLQKALDTVKNVQQSVLTPGNKQKEETLDKELDTQNKIIESLKEKLKKAVITERLLVKLLSGEKDKVSALEFHLKLADDKEKERKIQEEGRLPPPPGEDSLADGQVDSPTAAPENT